MDKERRDTGRHDCAVNITYFFDDGSSFRIEQNAQSINVTNKGMAIRTDRLLHAFENINFMIEGEQEVFSAEVVWCKKEPVFIGEDQHYTCGISYKQVIAEKVNRILKQIIGDTFVADSGQKNEPS